jgi:hypothetical protein
MDMPEKRPQRPVTLQIGGGQGHVYPRLVLSFDPQAPGKIPMADQHPLAGGEAIGERLDRLPHGSQRLIGQKQKRRLLRVKLDDLRLVKDFHRLGGEMHAVQAGIMIAGDDPDIQVAELPGAKQLFKIGIVRLFFIEEIPGDDQMPDLLVDDLLQDVFQGAQAGGV